MSYQPTTPTTKDVPSAIITKNLDTYHIHRLYIDLDPNNPAGTTITVRWSCGYMEDTTYIASALSEVVLSGAGLLTKIAELSDDTKSHYDNVRHATWELMQAEGHVPAGTVL